ncbi:MAG: AbrB/MazE/SpoVT family DNA-binding domain-containing protein [Syntrophorhabdales bacterium]
MELKIDKAGRIVVPKPLRERLGFKPDTELEAIEQPEGVLLRGSNNGLPWSRSMVCGSIRAVRSRGQTGSASLKTCARSGLSLF